ncbi:hypothetical protein AVEN_201487-1 [Araneus ventricosus]|uniref:Uncharacterized protein n=1 Tax=Araneus ventricosus TaxID=182803 RepID=A0A4Y2AG82_ARAVE|nr:hypothetical protein AVEN_51931-1 [Araneus ventricosus]GBN62617.1 hypothetical protein AVEN_201487-1 [Araneus ventricosus]
MCVLEKKMSDHCLGKKNGGVTMRAGRVGMVTPEGKLFVIKEMCVLVMLSCVVGMITPKGKLFVNHILGDKTNLCVTMVLVKRNEYDNGLGEKQMVV